METNPPIDILQIAVDRYYNAQLWWQNTQYMQYSEESQRYSINAMIALNLAGKDQESVKNFILQISDAENS